MKPRIRLRYGIWYCGLRGSHGLLVRPLGHGYTPIEAYAEWRQQEQRS
jgi:hypothetical protein